ncbi:MAG TPA: FxsA family protein [Dermatophilaceae bacterium]|nr:FxsA family protein [Dermatophilaceae bacterium]
MASPVAGRGWRGRLPLAALLAVPVVEVAVVVAVGNRIGAWWTILLLLACSTLGLLLLAREGRRSWTALRQAVATGTLPARDRGDAIAVLIGGILLVVPGFVTAAVGLLAVLPITRPVARRAVERTLARRLLGQRRPGEGDVVQGEVV